MQILLVKIIKKNIVPVSAVFISSIFYFVSYEMLHRYIDDSAGFFAAIPIILAGIFIGVKGVLWASLIVFPFHIMLFNFVHQNSFFRLNTELVMGIVASVFVCLIIGRLRDVEIKLRRAERNARFDLEEKKVFLKEIHHRVKNNLTIISSLIDMQIYSIKDENSKKIFQDTQNRITSIAEVHHQLYRSKNLVYIDINEYMQNLLNNIKISYYSSTKKIDLTVEIEAVTMSINSVINSGLIITELVTNSFKHAFLNQDSGEIRVEIKGKDPESIILTVSDNGAGFPAMIDYKNTDTLGFQLILDFVKRLGGHIELDTTKGTAVSISFCDRV